MTNRQLILTLAKVIIAAAWADGEISHEEENSLKDLLFQLPQIGLDSGMQLTAQEWHMLEMYMHTPVEPAERQRLIEELQIAVRSGKDKALVFEALDQMAAADGATTPDEQAMVAEIKAAIENVSTDPITQIGKLVGFAMQRRTVATEHSYNREHHLEDFIKNKVFYAVNQRLRREQTELAIPEADLRRLSLAGGLMAKVAHVDHEVNEEEFEVIARLLQEQWQVDEETAVFLAEVAVSEVADRLDHHRTVREFANMTEPAERDRFIHLLFAVADADGYVSYEEVEEIRDIARSMHVLNEQFIKAKLRIPRERRGA